ncbi:MAG: hypothetical protein ACRDHG_13720 [Anaerolineales bacterium]
MTRPNLSELLEMLAALAMVIFLTLILGPLVFYAFTAWALP